MSQIVTILVDYRDYKAAAEGASGLSYTIAPGIACPCAPEAGVDPKENASEIIRYVVDIPSADMAVRTGNALIGLTDAIQSSFGEYLRTGTDMKTHRKTTAVMADTVERMLRAYASRDVEINPGTNLSAIDALALAAAYPGKYLSDNGVDHNNPFRHQAEEKILHDIRLHLASNMTSGATAAALELFATTVRTATEQRTAPLVERLQNLRGG